MTILEQHLLNLKAIYKKMNPAKDKKEISYLKNLRLKIELLEKLLNQYDQ